MPDTKTGRDIKKKRSTASLGGKTISDPPSPALSAVHASGVSTPVPKLRLSGSTAASSASSSLLLKKNGTDLGTVDDKKNAKPEMKPSKDEEEDLTQSRWFVRTWPLRSTLIGKVAPEPTKRESRPHTPPAATETTTLDRDSDDPNEVVGAMPVAVKSTVDPSAEISNAANSSSDTIQPAPPVENASNTQTGNNTEPNKSAADTNTQQGWIGWLWYGSQQPAALKVASDSAPPKEPELPNDNATASTEQSEAIVPDPVPVGPEPAPEAVSIPPSVPVSEPQPESISQAPPPPVRSSWFGLWGGYPAPQPTAAMTNKTENTEGAGSSDSTAQSSSAEATAPAPAPVPPPVVEQVPQVANNVSVTLPVEQSTNIPESTVSKTPVATSSGWGFWYRTGGNATTSTTNTDVVAEPHSDSTLSASAQPLPQKGAVENTPVLAGPSQSQPTQSTKATSTPSTGLKVDPTAKDKNASAAPVQAKAPAPAPAPAVASPATAPPAAASPAVNKLQRICPPNHVFPDFDACYNLLDAPSLYCKLTRLFKKPQQLPKNHLFRAHAPRQVKKAVAIGVHGFFPMRLVRTVLGEPTGTSVRFAQSAAAAIKRWAEHNSVEIEVETVALEGEGKVADRVDMLWKLLEKWMDHVKNADFVMIGAHSQGVVVGLQLLARMIEQGWVDNARVGVAAMAGINLGPFYHLPTSILTGSAKELFEFQRPESAVSKKYIQALRVVLAHDVRIVFIGSIDDQLVPLESSTFSNIHHPYIYRAVFVDGRVHAPNFLSHLVGFAMKLRNLGISDHGLIRQLSIPLAGSLYGGEGHSRIYDDDRVYDLAVRHALETTDCPDVPLRVEPFELPTTNNNPFFLPWAMRGLLEEPFVRTKLEKEKNELLQQFEDWKPTSKVLKDVKFRLEGINQTKSKL